VLKVGSRRRLTSGSSRPSSVAPELGERAERQHWTQRQHGALTDAALRELACR
jgi:hypothetical protein